MEWPLCHIHSFWNNKETRTVCNSFCWHFIVPYVAPDLLRYSWEEQRKQCIPFTVACLFRISGEAGPQTPWHNYFCQVSIQNQYNVVFRPCYGAECYSTCFAHVTQGFINCSLLLLSFDSSFHCPVAPSADCRSEHSSVSYSRHWIAEGTSTHLAFVNRKCMMKLTVDLGML